MQIAPVNSELSADQLTKPSGDERNVLQMLPQRRDVDGIDIEAVEEVSPEDLRPLVRMNAVDVRGAGSTRTSGT